MVDVENSENRKPIRSEGRSASQINNSITNNVNVNVTYTTASEYASTVNQWLWQCYYRQCFLTYFPYFLLQSAYHYQNTNSGTGDVNRNFPSPIFPAQHNLGNTDVQNVNAQHVDDIHFQNQARRINEREIRAQPGRGQVGLQQGVGREFNVPPLWKRFLAEVVDFFILLVMKIVVTYLAAEFGVINIDRYGSEILEGKMDFKMAFEMTSDVLTLEVAHRIVVCLYEIICLHHGSGVPGGATPGKSVFGLRVVSCQIIEELGNDRIRVIPAGDIGLGWSFIRSFIKNFSMAFFFPASLTVFFFNHNRAVYDIVCNSLVVEDIPRQQRRN
ncbi:protein FAM8A1 [Tachypleus tridentatus]|uniref:protein FAM8A1 n=1 Tax=Tachypleus tridentatus TaxID=6853 RepID=UPI003FD307CD